MQKVEHSSNTPPSELAKVAHMATKANMTIDINTNCDLSFFVSKVASQLKSEKDAKTAERKKSNTALPRDILFAEQMIKSYIDDHGMAYEDAEDSYLHIKALAQ